MQTFSFRFIALLALVQIATCSCSILQKRKSLSLSKPVNELLQQQLNQICFSAEGRGRIQQDNHKYLFNYEALLDSPLKKWSVAVEIPFHGEKLLHFNFGAKRQISGSFYRELQHNLGGSNSDLSAFLNQVIDLLAFSDAFQQNEFTDYKCDFIKGDSISTRKGRCQNKQQRPIHWSISGEKVVVESTLIGGEKITLSSFSINNEKHSRITFLLSDKKEKELIKFELFHSQCTK